MKKLFISSILLLFVSAQPRPSRAADDLPERLSDSEFWQLVSDLSEPNGQFQYENFVSNEYNLQWVIPALLAKGQPASAYIGVGPEQNWRKFYMNVAVLPYDKDSVFIRSVFDASYGSDSKLSGIDEIMMAFSASRIRNYGDVIALSH